MRVSVTRTEDDLYGSPKMPNKTSSRYPAEATKTDIHTLASRPPERPMTHLEIIDKRLNILIEDLGSIYSRLHTDNDRKLGMIPEQLQKTGAEAKHTPIAVSGLAGNILIALDMLDDIRLNLRVEVERTEVL